MSVGPQAVPVVWAVVPVKSLDEAKSRLAGELDRASRTRLVLAMLHHTLDVLTAVEGLAGVAVISADRRIETVARAHGVRFLAEPRPGGLNRALTHAVAELKAVGARAVLVVPGDLPCLSPQRVESALSLLSTPGLVIAPDRRNEGTNLLLMAPPDLVPFSFGPGSFQSFLEAAEGCGIEPAILRSPDLGCDVDLPSDLELARGLPGWPEELSTAPSSPSDRDKTC